MQAKARILYPAIIREASMVHDFDYFDYLDDPGDVREHLYPDGLIAWSIAEDLLALRGVA
jgi:hypothetical protein